MVNSYGWWLRCYYGNVTSLTKHLTWLVTWTNNQSMEIETCHWTQQWIVILVDLWVVCTNIISNKVLSKFSLITLDKQNNLKLKSSKENMLTQLSLNQQIKSGWVQIMQMKMNGRSGLKCWGPTSYFRIGKKVDFVVKFTKPYSLVHETYWKLKTYEEKGKSPTLDDEICLQFQCLLCRHYCCLKSTWYPLRTRISVQTDWVLLLASRKQTVLK